MDVREEVTQSEERPMHYNGSAEKPGEIGPHFGLGIRSDRSDWTQAVKGVLP